MQAKALRLPTHFIVREIALWRLTNTELEISSKRALKALFSLEIMWCVCGPGLEASMDFRVTSTEMPFSIQGCCFPYNLTNKSSHKQKSRLSSEEIKQHTQSIQGWDGNKSNKLYCLPQQHKHTCHQKPAVLTHLCSPVKSKGILISCRASA